MKLFSICISLVLLFTPAFFNTAAAETRYVSDQLVITLRQGKTNQHKILRTLETGTPLEVLEEDESYLKVRTNDGLEGYVLVQYISSDPPKQGIIKRLEGENNDLKREIGRFKKSNDELNAKIATLQKNHAQELLELTNRSTLIEESLENIKQEQAITDENYSILRDQSENVITISEERDQLLKDKSRLASEVTSLRNQYEKLSDTRMIKWFLAGGGVLLFGWIIGKISRKKRTRY